jgi:DNA helicase IV
VVVDTERKAEQRHLDVLYSRLDELRVRSERALDSVRRQPTAGTPAARSERDAFVALHAGRLSQLRSVEERLCFGRLDLLAGERRYIGRIGLSDDEHRQQLIDWRAPAAEPFYRATAAQPDGVVRRRQLATERRQVTGIEDEVLDLDAYDPERDGPVVAGEGALMMALDAARTGRMRDIVGTIQAEQDRVIRSPLPGILVVEGAPGTGKTAVGLHRTAYLLYTYRDRIASAGVLVVGPNERFLRYIDAVLPALGEAEATVLVTPGRLYPGVDAVAEEDPEVAAVKGDQRMVEVLRRAVQDRQKPLSGPVELAVGGQTVLLRPGDVRTALERARRGGKPHNAGRVAFVKYLLGQLAAQLAGGRAMDPEERAGYVAELRESKDVRRELNGCWPPLRPERLLRDLFAQPERLESAGAALSTRERALLARARTAPWTPADVALLDEAAELLGSEETAPAPTGPSPELEYAREVLRDSPAAGMVSAEQLAERWAGEPVRRSVAEHATGDREWTYGHVVVDEAQELSPMTWRALMRRCPTRSMTVVGDLAQTGSLSGVRSWESTFRPYVADRFRIETLTVNYRTPAQLMALATAVLRETGLRQPPPVSARTTAWEPVFTAVPDVADAVAEVVRAELDLVGAGTLGVLSPHLLLDQVCKAIDGLLTDRIAVLTVRQAKGLEFDGVVLLEPSAIATESVRGLHDLYVAITRATQRLHVLHADPLPRGLR